LAAFQNTISSAQAAYATGGTFASFDASTRAANATLANSKLQMKW